MEALFDQAKNWGKWGAGDERHAVKDTAAAALISDEFRSVLFTGD